ncbi:PREDICTED: translation initiation factor IF-2-like, partial [Chinchilla lanigera]|uniref:translation initiation factor IF-2-like n=1 Tax=Chinchilla lanigera TaxID=34839 RepID=UPI000698E067
MNEILHFRPVFQEVSLPTRLKWSCLTPVRNVPSLPFFLNWVEGRSRPRGKWCPGSAPTPPPAVRSASANRDVAVPFSTGFKAPQSGAAHAGGALRGTSGRLARGKARLARPFLAAERGAQAGRAARARAARDPPSTPALCPPGTSAVRGAARGAKFLPAAATPRGTTSRITSRRPPRELATAAFASAADSDRVNADVWGKRPSAASPARPGVARARPVVGRAKAAAVGSSAATSPGTAGARTAGTRNRAGSGRRQVAAPARGACCFPPRFDWATPSAQPGTASLP